MKERILTCIVCPRGCTLKVALGDSGEVVSVSGNACPRGKTYAETECTHPTRTVTSTVLTEDGEIISVKTASPVPKELVFAVMKEINSARAARNAKIGDVIVENVAGTGVAVVATSNAKN